MRARITVVGSVCVCLSVCVSVCLSVCPGKYKLLRSLQVVAVVEKKRSASCDMHMHVQYYPSR